MGWIPEGREMPTSQTRRDGEVNGVRGTRRGGLSPDARA